MVLLAKRYSIGKQIGQGGMGDVYRAFDIEAQQAVAVKMLRKRHCEDGSYNRFIQEIEILKSVRHQNILTILDASAPDIETPFFVTPLLQGYPLSYYFNYERIHYPDAVDIAIQLLEGLNAAHQKDIIHRDLKPSNIFIQKSDAQQRYIVKILDFGVSKVLNRNQISLTNTGISIGTEQYMAPEQYINTENITKSADIYSVGLVLYQLFTHQSPFELVDGTRINPFTPIQFTLLRKYNQNVSKGVQKVVLKALNRDAKHRYSDAMEFLTALTRVDKLPKDIDLMNKTTATTQIRIPRLNRIKRTHNVKRS